jgi:hypothetical protein
VIDVCELAHDAKVAAARRYGSSDVSETVNDRSASISSLSAIVPVPDTARRGDAASSFSAITSLAMLMSPVTVPMPSSATKKSRTAPCTVYRGAANVPLPPAVKSSRPDSGGVFGDCATARLSTGMRCASKLN